MVKGDIAYRCFSILNRYRFDISKCYLGTACRSNGLSEERPVEATACRSNGLSKQRSVGAKSLQISVETTACRINGLSGQRGVESKACRCNGLSRQRRVDAMVLSTQRVSIQRRVDVTGVDATACRTNGVSTQRYVPHFRTSRHSDKWAFGQVTCNHI